MTEETEKTASQSQEANTLPKTRCRCDGLRAAYFDVDKATKLGVKLSLVFLIFKLWGQIINNSRNPTEMESLRWPDYAIGAMADLILASFFCSIGETVQAGVNIFGAISALTIVTQMCVYKPPAFTRAFDPHSVPATAAIFLPSIVIPGVVIILMKMCGKGEEVFARWMQMTPALGGGLVAYTISYEAQRHLGFETTDHNLMKASNAAALVVGFVILFCMALLKQTTGNTSGLLAMIVCMLQPLPQIWENFVRPASAAGVDISAVYLAMLGNGLGLARGWYIRNAIWIVGAGWACFIGGMLQSSSVLIANARVLAPFLTPLSHNVLIAFNLAFLCYACQLFSFVRRRRPMEESQNKEPTRKGFEAAV
jgi:hypothetical protein